MTERAVSTMLGYALALGITTLLVTGLLVGLGGFVEDERQRAVRSELQVVGQQIAADAMAADRFVGTGETEFTIRRDIPNDAAGVSYTVSVVVDDPSGDPPRDTYLRLSSTDPDVVVLVDMALETHITETSFSGGSIAVTYDTGSSQLVVHSDV